MPQFIPSLVIIVLLVVVLSSSIKIIHQQKIGLVERLGKFNRRLNPGPPSAYSDHRSSAA